MSEGDNREPMLSILENKEHPDLPVCLATGFFPKDGHMNLMSDKGPKSPIVLNNAPLSSDKTYFFVGLSKGPIENCSLHGVTESKEVPRITEEDKKSDTETQERQCVPPTAENVTEISTKHNDYPKVNFMSLAVNGLRILFAKTVTFNMLMTLKAVVF
ncbi:uncharacterized protein LOC118229037 [Anguilla anguilla]|uniref:uncharacterized protein LOC118229037 n=1 Tax=Anguilla anguilla TaxID=7936 RepID=UPI0015ABD0B0|nr:uncharacterized protein LOC118229037 [Anguilla anguilla]